MRSKQWWLGEARWERGAGRSPARSASRPAPPRFARSMHAAARTPSPPTGEERGVAHSMSPRMERRGRGGSRCQDVRG